MLEDIINNPASIVLEIMILIINLVIFYRITVDIFIAKLAELDSELFDKFILPYLPIFKRF